jgi:hypothetical protein
VSTPASTAIDDSQQPLLAALAVSSGIDETSHSGPQPPNNHWQTTGKQPPANNHTLAHTTPHHTDRVLPVQPQTTDIT